jgi:hypothetical protein
MRVDGQNKGCIRERLTRCDAMQLQHARMMMGGKLTLVGNSTGILNGSGGSSRARLPELPPGLLLGRLLGVRVGASVAVEEDVLLKRSVLVHALELGHGDDRLLPLSGRAGTGPLNIVVGRHWGKNAGIKGTTVVLTIRSMFSCTEKAPRDRAVGWCEVYLSKVEQAQRR